MENVKDYISIGKIINFFPSSSVKNSKLASLLFSVPLSTKLILVTSPSSDFVKKLNL